MPRGSGGGRSRGRWGRSGNAAKKDICVSIGGLLWLKQVPPEQYDQEYSFFNSLRWGSRPSTAEEWKSLFNSMVAKPMAAAIACKIMFMNVFKRVDHKAITGIQNEAKKAASS